jgi:hypothetical protein
MSPVSGNMLGQWHGTMEWALLLVIGAHVAAAMAHMFIFRDRIMQRMLPEKPMALTKIQKPKVARMKPARVSASDRDGRAGRKSNQAWAIYLLCDLVRPR